MLTRQLLPFSLNEIPLKRNWKNWALERIFDLRASFTGNVRDPLRVQLPQSEPRMNMALAVLLAVLLYIAALSLLAHHVLAHAASRMDQSLVTRVTYEILPDTTRTDDDKSQQERAKKLIEKLNALPGVKRAAVMDEKKMAELLQPWLGERIALSTLPLPLLIDVQLADGNAPNQSELQKVMQGIDGVELDDHARFQAELTRFVRAIKSAASNVLWLSLLALMLACYFAAEATFHMNRDEIELLHLIGAEDSAIAQHMGLAVTRIALIAACIALVFAFLTLIFMWLGSHHLNLALFPAFSMQAMDWVILTLLWLVTLFGAVGLCLLSARFTVLRALRKLL